VERCRGNEEGPGVDVKVEGDGWGGKSAGGCVISRWRSASAGDSIHNTSSGQGRSRSCRAHCTTGLPGTYLALQRLKASILCWATALTG
jgi:hypothetical protein